MARQRRRLADLTGQTYDLLIVGGGINGAGTAREAGLRGLKTLLVDRQDFAFGASSRSTKLVHGGLRYLEHGDYRLVAEALKERRILCDVLAPHLTRPLPFLVPVYAGDARPGWLIRAGLWLYDALAVKGRSLIRRHRWLDRGAALAAAEDLSKDGLKGAAEYWDCQMDDARVTLETLLDAERLGCETLNYCALVGATRLQDGDIEVRLRDAETGEQAGLRARLLILATGAWTDQVFGSLGASQAGPRVHATKGVHLVTRRLLENHALLVPARSDGRVFFVIPWELEGRPASLIGTTDSDYSGDLDRPRAQDDEIAYLIQETERVLPEARLTRSDVWSTFAGLRPLTAPPAQGQGNATVSREHTFWEEPGILAVTGGKFTTYRSLCQALVERAAKRLRRKLPASNSAKIPLPGAPRPGEPGGQALAGQISRSSGLSLETARLLVGHYGRLAPEVAALCQGRPDWARPLAPESGSPAVLCMAAWAALHEHAVHLDDFYLRRTRLGLSLKPDHAGVENVAAVMGSVLGWTPLREMEELRRLKTLVTGEYR